MEGRHTICEAGPRGGFLQRNIFKVIPEKLRKANLDWTECLKSTCIVRFRVKVVAYKVFWNR